MDISWTTFPLFVLLALAFLAIFSDHKDLPRYILSISLHTIAKSCILLAIIGTILSLYHHSTDVLSLYF